MLFISTRNPKIVCDFQTATLNSIAQSNDGIFVPVFFPRLTFEEIQKLSEELEDNDDRLKINVDYYNRNIAEYNKLIKPKFI